MLKLCQFPLTFLLISLTTFTAACSRISEPPQKATAVKTAPVSVQAIAPSSTSAASSRSATSKADPYQIALERASSAFMIGQSAQSRDDWRLVAKRWQQAIELMKAVPNSNPHRVQAGHKVAQYQQNLAYAKRQANRPTVAPNPGVIVLSPAVQPPPASPMAVAVPQAIPIASPSPQSGQIFYAPIIRREGNTPVVQVMFNQGELFDMIVDTGASGTLITRQMAATLGVKPVAQAQVDTASQRGVSFPLGYVQSIEVGGAVADNVLVAIAGSELDVGLLGHDFFGQYDVTIRENEVEFRER